MSKELGLSTAKLKPAILLKKSLFVADRETQFDSNQSLAARVAFIFGAEGVME
jgi:hypothetical protein